MNRLWQWVYCTGSEIYGDVCTRACYRAPFVAVEYRGDCYIDMDLYLEIFGKVKCIWHKEV